MMMGMPGVVPGQRGEQMSDRQIPEDFQRMIDSFWTPEPGKWEPLTGNFWIQTQADSPMQGRVVFDEALEVAICTVPPGFPEELILPCLSPMLEETYYTGFELGKKAAIVELSLEDMVHIAQKKIEALEALLLKAKSQEKPQEKSQEKPQEKPQGGLQ
jgi:hypothetical protein